MRIAIIGGGIAGMAAAYEFARLQENGTELHATLFEAGERLGGIVETHREAGYTIECGPDGWVTEKPWARELAEELGLGDQIIPSLDEQRKTYIVRDGRLVAMPDGMRMMVPTDLAALDASPFFTASAKTAYRAELARAEELRASAPQVDESVSDFVRRHFGEEVTTTVAAPLLSGVFGGDVEKLSVRAVMPAFVAMEREHGSLIAAMQAKPGTDKPIFTTLASGLVTLVDAMAEKIPYARLNDRVIALTREHSDWVVHTEKARFEFDLIVIATPADVTRTLLQPFDPVSAALLPTEASSALLIAFGFAETLALPAGFGFLVPPVEENPLLAGTFVHQKFAGRAPEGASLLRAFLGGDKATRLLHADDAEIAAVARAGMETIVGTLPEPEITIVRRWPRSLPQYAVGHVERIAELEARIAKLPALHLLGNAYHGVGLPDLIGDGRAKARAIADQL